MYFCTNMQWNQSWQLNLSTIVMACNYSDVLDPAAVPSYHIVDIDWSSGKELWAKAHPMNAEESIEQQAIVVASAQPGRRVFVYRNAIKALPWFSSVRSKLANRSYSAWFVPFGPPTVNGTKWHVPECDTNYDPPLCSTLYHDQVQTPSYPGYCEAPACDCGGVPCGEYVFDFRAANVSIGGQSFVSWFVEEYFFGTTGLGNAAISGLYVDDFWSARGGPSEMDAHAVADMGLNASEVAEMTAAYTWVLAQATAAVEARAKWTWSEYLNNDPCECIVRSLSMCNSAISPTPCRCSPARERRMSAAVGDERHVRCRPPGSLRSPRTAVAHPALRALPRLPVAQPGAPRVPPPRCRQLSAHPGPVCCDRLRVAGLRAVAALRLPGPSRQS